MTRALVISVLTGLLVLFTTSASQAEPRPLPTPCNWRTEYERTIYELGDDPSNWFLLGGEPMRDPKRGIYFGMVFHEDGSAAVNPATPCRLVADVVRHEWMHLQQWRMYGPDFGAVMLGKRRLELVADCGSMLLGSKYTPYLQQETCTQRDLRDARRLIDY